jgi:hypothetical protein
LHERHEKREHERKMADLYEHLTASGSPGKIPRHRETNREIFQYSAPSRQIAPKSAA